MLIVNNCIDRPDIYFLSSQTLTIDLTFAPPLCIKFGPSRVMRPYAQHVFCVGCQTEYSDSQFREDCSMIIMKKMQKRERLAEEQLVMQNTARSLWQISKELDRDLKEDRGK